ncbi:hypothetical protein EC988_003264, partial [Linderina pennispora]
MSTVDIGDDSTDSLAGNTGATGGWSLRVKALLEGGTEREYRVEVQPSATVGDFRTKLSSKSQVAVHRLRLIFSGRVLANDSQRLADAGVEDGCALHMVVRPAATAGNSDAASGQQRESPGQGRAATDGRQRAGRSVTVDIPIYFHAPENVRSEQDQQQQRDRLGRTIATVYRNFGAGDGGEWIARTLTGSMYRIDREAAERDLLTDEEMSRGTVPRTALYPASESEHSGTPIPGLVYSQTTSGQEMASQRVVVATRPQPTRSQANELIYDLLENILPAIRRVPGREDFDFDRPSTRRSRYISHSEPAAEQVGAAGLAVRNLGDALVEVGRMFQHIGLDIRDTAHGESQADAENRSQLAERAAQAARQVLAAAPLALPFLESSVQLPAELPSARTNPTARGVSVSRHDHILCVSASHGRRRNRRMAMGLLSSPGNAMFFGPGMSADYTELLAPQMVVESMATWTHPAPPAGMQHGAADAQTQRPNTQAYVATMQAAQRFGASALASASTATTGSAVTGRNTFWNVVNSAPAPTAHDNGANTASGRAAPSTGDSTRMHATRTLQNGNILDVYIDTIAEPSELVRRMRSAAQPAPTPAQPQPATSSQPAPARPQPAASLQPTPTETSNGQQDLAANPNFLGFIDRLYTLGSQASLGDDRSDRSTTTEYGSAAGSVTGGTGGHPPRIFSTFSGSSGAQGMSVPSTSDSPFSFTSMVLGFEPIATTAGAPPRPPDAQDSATPAANSQQTQSQQTQPQRIFASTRGAMPASFGPLQFTSGASPVNLSAQWSTILQAVA